MPRGLTWSAERVDELRAVMAGGSSYREAAETLAERWQLAVDYTQVRLTCVRYHIASLATQRTWYDKTFRRYTDAWKLSGDWIICGDPHLPYVDIDWCNTMTETARRLKCRHLLIAGDIFDFETLSPFAAVTSAANPDDERRATEGVVDEWLSWFREIRCLCGNHDLRLAKRLDGAVGSDDVLSVLAGRMGNHEAVQWSIYGYALIDSPTGTWRISHPRNYSQSNLAVAQKLAARHRQHIVTFHEHRTAIGFDPSGQSVIVNCGCMADPERLAYKQLSDSTHPEFTQSFCTLTGGRVKLHSPHEAWGN